MHYMRGCLMGVECKTTLRRPRIVCVLPVPGGPCIQNPCGLHFSHHHQHSILKATKYVWHGKLDGTQRRKLSKNQQSPDKVWKLQFLRAAVRKFKQVETLKMQTFVLMWTSTRLVPVHICPKQGILESHSSHETYLTTLNTDYWR